MEKLKSYFKYLFFQEMENLGEGKLHLFIDTSEPKKTEYTWASTGYFPTIIEIPRVYFLQIHWHDEKPTKFKPVINE